MTAQTVATENKFSIASASIKSFPKYTEVLPLVARDFDKSVTSQLTDMAKFSLGRSKLTTDEYYSLSLYDDQLSKPEKLEFAGINRSRRIWTDINKVNSWMGLLDHKVLFETALSGLGFPTTRTLGVLGPASPGPNIPHFANADALAEFLVSAEFPIFGKPVNSRQSIGAISINGFDGDELILSGEGDQRATVDEFANEILELFPDGFLLQEQLLQHPELTRMCGKATSTLRVVTINRGNGPEVYRSVMKVVGGDNVADNFWRTGNLLAPVDLETWKLESAIDGMGFHAQWHDEHPVTNAAIKGFQVPFHEEIQKTVVDAAKFLDTACLLGWDVAVTADGPVIIEANQTPDLIMLQVAHRKGVWDDALRQTVEYAKQVWEKQGEVGMATLKSEASQARKELLNGVQRD